MISCYVIGEISTVEVLRDYIIRFPLTEFEGYCFHYPENFNEIYAMRPDVIFVDAFFMERNASFLSRIRQFSSIVIIGADTEMAYEALEHLAFDYLVKPLSFERFVRSMEKFNHLVQLAYAAKASKQYTITDSFFIKADSKGQKELLIKCAELLFIEALQNYVILHMANGQQFTCYNSMKEMEESLPDSEFSRVHKSYLINDSKISAIDGNTIILADQASTNILIGNTYKKSFLDKKNQKMIRKQRLPIQILKYSKLATCFLLCFSINYGFNETIDLFSFSLFI